MAEVPVDGVINLKYRCPDPRCGAEMLVSSGAPAGVAQGPYTCGCGAVFVSGWLRPAYIQSTNRFTWQRSR